MFKYILIFIFFVLISNSKAEKKEKIIENLQNIENFKFKFEQNINGKIENGICTIKYPKKIYCNYKKNNKILVSNGKSLVIKTELGFNRYSLEKTPLNLILDKNFLIKKINTLEENIIDNNLINFTIVENDNEINIFFDNETFNLVGWKTRDIYQNTSMTYLFSLEINKKISKNLFNIPNQN
jgi:outer membrane lipoprotein-sorting protein